MMFFSKRVKVESDEAGGGGGRRFMMCWHWMHYPAFAFIERLARNIFPSIMLAHTNYATVDSYSTSMCMYMYVQ
jgi:hypothetical protein